MKFPWTKPKKATPASLEEQLQLAEVDQAAVMKALEEAHGVFDAAETAAAIDDSDANRKALRLAEENLGLARKRLSLSTETIAAIKAAVEEAKTDELTREGVELQKKLDEDTSDADLAAEEATALNAFLGARNKRIAALQRRSETRHRIYQVQLALGHPSNHSSVYQFELSPMPYPVIDAIKERNQGIPPNTREGIAYYAVIRMLEGLTQ